jgi:putative transposase
MRTVSFPAERCANANAELQEFIDYRQDAREVRKALAVKLVYQGYKYDEIQTILVLIDTPNLQQELPPNSCLFVTYESKRSYYDLFDAAGISWKKTTSFNPKADEDDVAAKKRD